MNKEKSIFNRKGELVETNEVSTLREMRISYYTCLARALQQSADSETVVRLTARECRQTGLPEEACVLRTAAQERLGLTEDEVRKIFRAVYVKGGGELRSAYNQKERIARSVSDFFARRYQLRYNTVKKVEEWRPNDGAWHSWRQLTDRDLNRMTFEQMGEGGEGWGIDLQLFLHSTLIPQYNPLTTFLEGCGRWGQRVDHISLLARRVPTDYEDWEPLFHRWFLGMVAQWMGLDQRFGNMLVPMLIGAQGTHKKTFCRIILPPVLRDYFIDDIKMDNAEQVERVLARMALVNIDEYNAKTEREQAKIKRILAEKDVQVRRMRSDQYVRSLRTASFIATTNSPRPLTDPTGSRRYLCCPVTGVINTEPTVNYRQLYAQAVWELKHGVPYYPTREEECRMEAHNAQFQQMKKVDIVLTEYFEPMERNKDNLMYFPNIVEHLQERVGAANMPNVKDISVALAQHFQTGAYKGHRGWYMRPRI